MKKQTEIKVEIVVSGEDSERLYMEVSRYKNGKKIGDTYQWAILEDEVSAIMKACVDYLSADDGRSGKGLSQKNETSRDGEDIPFIAIGNDELKEPIGETAKCPNCGKIHKVEYGEKVNKDGSKTLSRMLGFVNCGKKTYLVAIDGKGIK